MTPLGRPTAGRRKWCDAAIVWSTSSGQQFLVLQPLSPPQGIRVTSFVCDVADAEQMNAFAEQVREVFNTGHINLLFNNAGWGMLREFEPRTKFNELGDWHFAEMAGPLGGTGERVTTRAQLEAALGRALQANGRFYLIEIMLQPGTTSETLARYAKGFASQAGRTGK